MPSWTEEAADDLEAILDYIAADNPQAAAETVREIEVACNRLDRFPNLGRPGAVPGTREIVLPRLPYLVVYRTTPGRPTILRVLHGKMRWPG